MPRAPSGSQHPPVAAPRANTTWRGRFIQSSGCRYGCIKQYGYRYNKWYRYGWCKYGKLYAWYYLSGKKLNQSLRTSVRTSRARRKLRSLSSTTGASSSSMPPTLLCTWYYLRGAITSRKIGRILPSAIQSYVGSSTLRTLTASRSSKAWRDTCVACRA